MPVDAPQSELDGVLRRLAGWAPDEAMAAARTLLAAARPTEAAQVAAYAARAYRVPMRRPDVETLLAALAGTEPDLTPADFQLVDALELPWFRMSPTRPGDRPDDPVDARAVRAVAGTGTGVQHEALWRTWRGPATPTPWPPPRRLYLLQVAAEAQPAAHLLQQALRDAETPAPLVEAFTADDVLPPYHRAALADAVRVWCYRPVPPVRIATVFDAVEATGGPGFTGARVRLEPGELARVAAYLDAAPPIVTTTATMVDVVAPGRGATVPMGFRTDGWWSWPDAVGYYVHEHGVAPQAELLDHIRDQRYQPPVRVDRVALHQALRQLQAPADGDP